MATPTTCPMCDAKIVCVDSFPATYECTGCGQVYTQADLEETELEGTLSEGTLDESPQTFWTFIDLDWNLIRDDSDQADNFPCLLFKTVEAAQAAAQLFWDRLLKDDEDSEMPYPELAEASRELEWHKTFDEYEASPREGFVLRVYSMEVQP